MLDLALWNLLVVWTEEGVTPPLDELHFRLERLALLKPRQRFPFFELLRTPLTNGDPKSRLLALRALAGARGRHALELILSRLEEDGGLEAAIQTFHGSVDADRLRWIHLLFHPEISIRSAAMGLTWDSLRWMHLFLLEDSDVDLDLYPRSVPDWLLPMVLRQHKDGKLPEAVTRQLVTTRGVKQLLEGRSIGSVPTWLSQGRPPPVQTGEDPLRDLLELFWGDELNGFWKGLIAELSSNEPGCDRLCLVVACLQVAEQKGSWVQPAALLVALFWPPSLAWDRLPLGSRRSVLGELYRFGPSAPKWEADELFDLVENELFWSGEELPDLRALGGVLALVAGCPYQVVRTRKWRSLFGQPQIARAVNERPGDTLFFFLLEDRSGTREKLLRNLWRDPGAPRETLAAAALCRDVVLGREFIRHFTLTELMVTLGHLQHLEAHLSAQRVSKTAEALAPKLVVHLQDYLHSWLTGELGGDLVARTLAEVARLAGPETFATAVSGLAPVLVAKLLNLIDHIPSFPYGVEFYLAQQLSAGEHREWADARLPALVAESAYPRWSAPVETLGAAEATEIRDCDPVRLPAALAPAVLKPVRGLVEPLGDRPPAHCLEACLALLGCHDPVVEVAWQFERFLGPSFLERLDSRAVGNWERCGNLPLHGHCWLHRWERHLFLVGERVEDRPQEFAGMLQVALELPSPVLGREIWLAAVALTGVWRYRDKPKLVALCRPEVLEVLLKGLAGRHGPQAALCLLRFYQSGVDEHLMEGFRTRVLEKLPDCSLETRAHLSAWVSSGGLGGATLNRRAGKEAAPEDVDRIRKTQDLEYLEEMACQKNVTVAEEASLRLAELGLAGTAILAQLLEREAAPHAPILAETVAFWVEGEPLVRARRLALGAGTPPELVFVIAAALRSRASDPEMEEVALRAVLAEVPQAWFRPEHWRMLADSGVDPGLMSLRLVECRQPYAYNEAVAHLLARNEPAGVEPLERFLLCSPERMLETRLRAAVWLLRNGSQVGVPLLFWRCLTGEEATSIVGSEMGSLELLVRSAMLAGKLVEEGKLIKAMSQLELDKRGELAPLVLAHSTDAATCGALLEAARRSPRRAGLLKRVADAFVWGMAEGRHLTGRLFQVSMHGGEALGFTRLTESRIHVNPLPMFRHHQHAEDIVKGLMLHEFGHHLYHAGKRELEIWDEAKSEGLQRLLNLVADEHLERNMRAMSEDYGRRLKRLGAYGFQHAQRDVPIHYLLRVLGRRAHPVLMRSALGVSSRPSSVRLGGEVFRAMEKAEFSFTRFARALRMGLGNRWGDPKVEEALALFDRRFRDSDMERLLEVTRELRRIFGKEIELLQCFDQEYPTECEPGELAAAGEGITDDEVQREIRRQSLGPPRAVGQINRGLDEDFPPMNTVVPVDYDPFAHRQYAAQVQGPARRMREYFKELGSSHVKVTQRVQGRAVDRGRLHRAVIHRDPKILVARKLVHKSDLFLGLLVDCSSSMEGDCIHKARLFGSLLAESGRGLSGVEVRVLGFTDQLIYDAGDANRCACASLEAGGGNNDAGALAYAATLAQQSRRKAKLLVMISDGLPTECTVTSLKKLVQRLSRRHICCAQVAVRPLKEVCFPHYVELTGESDFSDTVRRFGLIVARLVRRAMRA